MSGNEGQVATAAAEPAVDQPDAGTAVAAATDTTTPAPATTDTITPTPTPTTTATKRAGGRWWWVGGIAIAVLVVVLLAPLASSDPDGLERVAEDQGFIGQATNLIGGLLGDYALPGVGNEAVSTVLSGLLGIAIVVGLLFLLGRLMARRRA